MPRLLNVKRAVHLVSVRLVRHASILAEQLFEYDLTKDVLRRMW